jgi:L-ornithine N5-oxygenase
MIHDVIGIGFGPSNMALAIAMEECGFEGSALFLEGNADALWQEGMLLDGSDIQNNPLRDLITPVNPRSRFTFTNYLHETGRLFHYLNLGVKYPLRKDYFRYVNWVAGHFGNVEYDAPVTDLVPVEGESLWRVVGAGGEHLARSVVVGVGRKPNIPPTFTESANVVHLSHFLPALRELPTTASIAVVGASQSAVEILLHLLDKGYEDLCSVHRSFSYRLKDTSPFSDEVYFPEFVDYYHALPPAGRTALDAQVRPTNYSSADGDVLEALYLRMYEMELDGRAPLRILRNHRVTASHPGTPVVLELEEVYTGKPEEITADLVVLATGFLDIGRNGRDGVPWLLRDVAPRLRWTSEHLDVRRDYAVEAADEDHPIPPLYLNGLCESSHGLGDAGSFSLVSIRAREILHSIERNLR